MTDFILDRTGMPPVKFKGELLRESTSHQEEKGFLSQRWHELKLYRTESGRYVVSITLRTLHRQEFDRTTLYVCESPGEATEILQTYSPQTGWTGFPDRPQFAGRQQHLVTTICNGYDDAVTRLLAGLSDFSEVVS